MAEEGPKRSRRRRRASVSRAFYSPSASPPILPTDVLTATAAQLELPEILQLCSVNQAFAQLCQQEVFWNTLLKQQFGHTLLVDKRLLPLDHQLLFAPNLPKRLVYSRLWLLHRLLAVVDFLGGFNRIKYTFSSNRYGLEVWSSGAGWDGIVTVRFADSANRHISSDSCMEVLGHEEAKDYIVPGTIPCYANYESYEGPHEIQARNHIRRWLAALYWHSYSLPETRNAPSAIRLQLYPYELYWKSFEDIVPFVSEALQLATRFYAALTDIMQRYMAVEADANRLGLHTSKANIFAEISYGLMNEAKNEEVEVQDPVPDSQWKFSFYVWPVENKLYLIVPSTRYRTDLPTALGEVVLQLQTNRLIAAAPLPPNILLIGYDEQSYRMDTKQLMSILLALCEALVDTAPLLPPDILKLHIYTSLYVQFQNVRWPLFA